jgi:protein-disulfide isomerase
LSECCEMDLCRGPLLSIKAFQRYQRMIKDKENILLFISKDSVYFQTTMDEFSKLLKTLEEMQPFTSEVIDVNEKPEMAEKHKIDALPTLIIGDKRFIGQLKTEKITEVLSKEEKVSS